MDIPEKQEENEEKQEPNWEAVSASAQLVREVVKNAAAGINVAKDLPTVLLEPESKAAVENLAKKANQQARNVAEEVRKDPAGAILAPAETVLAATTNTGEAARDAAKKVVDDAVKLKDPSKTVVDGAKDVGQGIKKDLQETAQAVKEVATVASDVADKTLSVASPAYAGAKWLYKKLVK